MARAAEARRWSDFVLLPEDDRRELVDGVLLEVERPTKWHEFICAFLIKTLMTWGEQRGLVVLGVPEYWLVNPETRSLVVHRLHSEGQEVFRSKTFKGLRVPLASLWSRLPKKLE